MLMNNDIIISNHEPQDITITQDDNQLIFINGGGEVIGITDVLVNGVSVVNNNIAYVLVPTKTSQLQNNSGFLTSETDPTVPSYIKTITLADINSWNNKQEALVSGTNIKTINNTSLLGSGNINVGGAEYSAGTGISIDSENVISNTITSYEDLTDLPIIPSKTSDLINDSDFVSEDDLAEVSFTGSYNSLSDTPIIPDSTSELINDSDFITSSEVSTEIQTAISTKQDTLVSGTNIKTVNNNSLLGSGNISISGGSATDVQINGTSIVSNNVADIKTQSIYNGNTNKLATMHDLNYNLNLKQDTLVSGTNIKTINNNSLLGSGNINLEKSFLKAKISADVNSTNSYTEINNMILDVNRGNLSVENGKIKIGSGITYIKITINLGMYSAVQTALYSYFLLNGNNYGNWTVKQINDFDSIITTEIIGVSENDIISFNIYTSNNATLNKDRTIIIVEEM